MITIYFDTHMIGITTRLTTTNLKCKAGAHADDINMICGSDAESVQNVSKQYERFTKKSGLVLNAEKTEILTLHTPRLLNFDIVCNG